MTDRLTEIRERWAKATLGPWKWTSEFLEAASVMEPCPDRCGGWDGCPGEHAVSLLQCNGRMALPDEPDAEAIAHAPDDIDFLLAEIERHQDIAAGLLEAPCGECGQ